MKSLLRMGATLSVMAIAPTVLWIVIVTPISIYKYLAGFPREEAQVWQFFFGVFQSVYWVLFLAGFVFIVACAHLLILGLPAFLVGRWFKAIHLWSILAVAFLIGAGPFAILAWSWSNLSRGDILSVAAILGIFGMSGGLPFWRLWNRSIPSTSSA